MNFSYRISYLKIQGWGPRGLASTSRTPRGQNNVALASKTLALALASTMASSNTSRQNITGGRQREQQS